MPNKSSTFRVGKVRAYLRGRVWYLCYYENGARRRPRAGADRAAARRLAARVNAELEAGAPAALSFEPVSVVELRRRWLEHHELVLRSSVRTVDRYRTATDHLLRYLQMRPVRHASDFRAAHAEGLVRHLRGLRVSPNGHPNTPARPLMDRGLRFVLECCRALFNFAAKRRHLPPYAEGPFAGLAIGRIPVEQARPLALLSAGQERELLGACDDWQLPLFLTLLLTGLRPGELCHLLLPGDVDLNSGLLRVRNKPRLGWQVKTRSERDVPLVGPLAAVLRAHLAGRPEGPAFLRRGWAGRPFPGGRAALEQELARRCAEAEAAAGGALPRVAHARLARRLWRDAGALREGAVRLEYTRLAAAAGCRGCRSRSCCGTSSPPRCRRGAWTR